MQSFAEGLNLAEEVGMDPKALLDIISLGAIAAPMFALKVRRPAGFGAQIDKAWDQGAQGSGHRLMSARGTNGQACRARASGL